MSKTAASKKARGEGSLRSALARELLALRAQDRAVRSVRPLLRAGRAYYITCPEDRREVTDMAAQVEVDHADALVTQYEQARDTRMAVQQAQHSHLSDGWDL